MFFSLFECFKLKNWFCYGPKGQNLLNHYRSTYAHAASRQLFCKTRANILIHKSKAVWKKESSSDRSQVIFNITSSHITTFTDVHLYTLFPREEDFVNQLPPKVLNELTGESLIFGSENWMPKPSCLLILIDNKLVVFCQNVLFLAKLYYLLLP